MRKCQSREFYERPLTPEEAKFAENNLNLVYWFLNQQKLDEDAWFGVVVLRYLLSVKKYVSNPDLQQYSFATIACNAMRSAVRSEREKQDKQIKTVSLYDLVPGMNDFTYEDTVTARNLNFVPYMERGENMKVAYNVELPDMEKTSRHLCEERIALERFLAGDKTNMCFEYETKEEAKRRSKAVRNYRPQFSKLGIYFEVHLVKNRIYITKTAKKVVTSEAR